VVVPEQTREMVAALRAAGQCAEMVWFDEEGHGFRSPENQVTMLDTLWRFYRRLSE
jgi:dipeptidyl aminopeptidase/acylaminoacyl peptidase